LSYATTTPLNECTLRPPLVLRVARDRARSGCSQPETAIAPPQRMNVETRREIVRRLHDGDGAETIEVRRTPRSIDMPMAVHHTTRRPRNRNRRTTIALIKPSLSARTSLGGPGIFVDDMMMEMFQFLWCLVLSQNSDLNMSGLGGESFLHHRQLCYHPTGGVPAATLLRRRCSCGCAGAMV